MKKLLMHIKRGPETGHSLIELTASGLCREQACVSSVLLLQIVVGTLLVLGVSLLGLQIS